MFIPRVLRVAVYPGLVRESSAQGHSDDGTLEGGLLF